MGYGYVWYWKVKLPERKNERCRVILRAKSMNSILIEFESDKQRFVTSRFAIRKVG